jgi:hypothetical protein
VQIQRISQPPSTVPSSDLSIYSCCSQLVHRAFVKRFVSLQFLNLRQSVGLLGRGFSPSQSRYVHTNTEKTQTNIHTLIGIRTHDPSVRESEDSSCLRLRGHCERPSSSNFIKFYLGISRTLRCA